jgi:hypothetical protein
MRLETIKGLHRASLCLAVGYIQKSDFARDTREKCEGVVAKYLNDNGIKFDFTTKPNRVVVRRTVRLAEDVIFGGMELERAIQKLEERLF